MSKQTAVEWLVEKYELVGMLTLPMIERAQAMEREQMGEAFDESRFTNQWVVLTESAFQHKSFEEYYNETYKGGEQ